MKGVIFSRVSSTNGRQDTTRQVEDLQKVAKNRGIEVVKVFQEEISGAKKNGERHILQECLSFCEEEGVDVILVSELSRLGRDTFELFETIKHCKEKCINIYFEKEGFSILNKNGKPSPFLTIIVSVLATCCEMERESIYFRLKSGREKYIREGGKLGRKRNDSKTQEEKEEDLEKEKERLRNKYPKLIKDLRKYSLRVCCGLSHVSLCTAQRVKKLLDIKKESIKSKI